MRIHTVNDLKEYLEEFDEDTQVMIVHQSSWPLREVIGGLWLDDGTPEEDENECQNCARLTLADPEYREFEDEPSKDGWYAKCFHCGTWNETQEPMPKEEQVLYLVANGHPYDGTPYGSKRAWSAI